MRVNVGFFTSAPVVMGVELLVALAFAVGHHAFYQKLNGSLVKHSGPAWISKTLSYDVSDQQINVSIGTFFAFLVKALLGALVSTAFDQFTWRRLVNSTSSRIGVIDDLFAVLKNGFFMLNYKLWRGYPTSMLLATLIWLLPVASVISPATLNVQMAPRFSYIMGRVPQVDFRSSNFVFMSTAAPYPVTDYIDTYMAATPEVQRIVTSAATQGSILGISPFSTNSSWELDFHGPALDCRNVDQTLYDAILNDVETTINTTYESAKHGDAATYGFLSWVPYNDSTEGMMPFYDGVTVMSPGTFVKIMAPRSAELGPIANSVLQGGTVGEGEWSGATATSPLSIFLAAFPHIADPPKQDLTDVYRLARDPTIIKCSLYNSSYETNFTYVNGEQEINIKNHTLLNGVGYMDSVGFEGGSAGDPSAYYSTWETYSYQAVMACFGRLLGGAVSNLFQTPGGGQALGYVAIQNSSVMSTSLSDTKELQMVRAVQNKVNLGDAFGGLWKDISVAQTTSNSSLSLLDATEEMFRNITISMMSSNLFQPNYSIPSAPSNVNITVSNWSDVYTYSKPILWTAYGIALGFTLLSTCLGIIAHFTNNGSYTTKFSTILRTTQQASVSPPLKPKDCSGKDPLPDSIAKSTICLFSGKGVNDTGDNESTAELENVSHVRRASGVSDESGIIRQHSLDNSRSPSLSISEVSVGDRSR